MPTAESDAALPPAPGRQYRLEDLRGAGAYVVNAEGVIVEVNSRAERLLGRTTRDLLGQDAHDLLHRDADGQPLPRARCPMRQVCLSGSTAMGDRAWYLLGDDTLELMRWMITPCGDSPTVAEALVVFHPVSDDSPDTRRHSPHDVHLSELERLALLAETTTQLTSTLDIDETLRRLVNLVVPRLADWAVVDLRTEHDDVWRAVVAHHDGETLAYREDLQGPMPPVTEDSPRPLSRALRGAASTLAGPETYQRPPDSGIAIAQRHLFEATGMHSAAIAPIRGLREVLGALTLGRSGRPGRFTDLSLLEDITRRAGLALENARLYQRQRRVSETMQRHLLPSMPRSEGMDMAVRYGPAPDASHVGGDWYDAFALPDGSTALVIGDVIGHDLEAAAGMAQIRNMLRAYAWSYQEPPAAIVERLDHAMEHMTDTAMATVVFARVEEDGTEGRRIRWSNAGHPPPLLVGHDGMTQMPGGPPDPPLGLGGGQGPRSDHDVHLPPQATLVLYTDGLIESPRRPIDEGLRQLRRHAAALTRRPLDVFCDLLLDRVRPDDNDDDVALLALRLPQTRAGRAGRTQDSSGGPPRAY